MAMLPIGSAPHINVRSVPSDCMHTVGLQMFWK
jgi:hypothetical protein